MVSTVSYSLIALMAFNQEKALVGAFSVITNLRMDLFEALFTTQHNIGEMILEAGPSRSYSWELETTICAA